MPNSSPKRAAVCFSGQARINIDSLHSLARHVLVPLENEGYEINVFMHLWDTVTQGAHTLKFLEYTPDKAASMDEEIFRKSVENVKNDFPVEADVEKHQDNFIYFLENFPPNGACFEALLQEEDFVLKNFIHPQERSAWAYNSQYHSVRASHDICRLFEDQQGFRYDLVLRVRPDHTFLDPLPFDEISPDFICVPSTNGHGKTRTHQELDQMLLYPGNKDIIETYCRDSGITLKDWRDIQTQVYFFDSTHVCNDQFAISSSENMYQYSRLIEFIHKNIEDPSSLVYQEMILPEGIGLERMLFLHIQEFCEIKTFFMRNRLEHHNMPLEGTMNNVMVKYLEQRENT